MTRDCFGNMKQYDPRSLICASCPNFEGCPLGEKPRSIYADGAGFNGRHSKVCVKVDESALIKHIYKHNYTNNEIEYKALLVALNYAEKGTYIYMDSQLVVKQVLGHYKVHNRRLKVLRAVAAKKLNEVGAVLEWIPRGENLAGQILDKSKREGLSGF